MPKLLSVILLCLLFQSCNNTHHVYSQNQNSSYLKKPGLNTQAISDTDIMTAEMLNSMLDKKVVIPDKVNLAVLKLSNRWGYNQPGFETHYLSILREKLPKDKVIDLTQIPKLLINKRELSMSHIRKAAARLQCNLILIYEIDNYVTVDHNLFGKDKAKTYTTANAYLIDTRTGVLPSVISVDQENESIENSREKSKEFMMRSQIETTEKVLIKITDQLNQFFSK